MKGSLRLRAAFRVFRKSSTLAFLQLDSIAARQQPAAMSCQRGHERWRASMAAVCYGAVLIVLSKPDIAYRGVVGASLQDLA